MATGDSTADLSDVPVVVNKIHVQGLGRTKDDIVKKHLSSIFGSGNMQEMLKNIQMSRSVINSLGLFKNVNVFIDTSALDIPNGYDVYFRVEESRRVTGSISTLVGTNDGSLLFACNLPNAFGRGEVLSADYTYGSKSTWAGTKVSFRKFVAQDPNLIVNLGAVGQNSEFPWSGYKEMQRALFADFQFPTFLGHHNLRWGGVWSQLSSLSNTTAFSVRKESGHSLKSSVFHECKRDTRDCSVFPTHGYLVKSSQEFAGLGGDVHFVKQELDFQLNKKLFLDSVLQLSFGAGLAKHIGPDTQLNIQDRFFLGGPLTLRGFDFKACAPSEDGNALGANCYWQAAAHVYTPLPFRPGKGGFGEMFRTHFFVNAGNLAQVNFQDNRMDVPDLIDTTRISYGAGIALRIAQARLELNYCVPLRSQPGDKLSSGLQVGVGISFL